MSSQILKAIMCGEDQASSSAVPIKYKPSGNQIHTQWPVCDLCLEGELTGLLGSLIVLLYHTAFTLELETLFQKCLWVESRGSLLKLSQGVQIADSFSFLREILKLA